MALRAAHGTDRTTPREPALPPPRPARPPAPHRQELRAPLGGGGGHTATARPSRGGPCSTPPREGTCPPPKTAGPRQPSAQTRRRHCTRGRQRSPPLPAGHTLWEDKQGLGLCTPVTPVPRPTLRTRCTLLTSARQPRARPFQESIAHLSWRLQARQAHSEAGRAVRLPQRHCGYFTKQASCCNGELQGPPSLLSGPAPLERTGRRVSQPLASCPRAPRKTGKGPRGGGELRPQHSTAEPRAFASRSAEGEESL